VEWLQSAANHRYYNTKYRPRLLAKLSPDRRLQRAAFLVGDRSTCCEWRGEAVNGLPPDACVEGGAMLSHPLRQVVPRLCRSIFLTVDRYRGARRGHSNSPCRQRETERRDTAYSAGPPLTGASPRPLVRPVSTAVPFPSSPAFSQSRSSSPGWPIRPRRLLRFGAAPNRRAQFRFLLHSIR
jgi:hypothetical protein